MEKNKQSVWKEETVKSEQIFKGRVISLQLDTVTLRDGTTVTREIVRHPGAAAVIAIVDGKMVMVEQYRKPMDKVQLEIPAGKLDPKEEPEQAAIRELEEETGYRARSITLLEKFYTSPGFADELLYVYYTDDVILGQMNLDEDEEINVYLVTLEEAEQFIESGYISDVKTVFAIYAWKLLSKTGSLK